MNSEDLSCPSCHESYSDTNPPRLLTMCGHTFCHHCIKSLITKRKDKGFKVKCPIDNISAEMEKPNPSLFPKNIALMTMINKSKVSQSYNEFLSVEEISKDIKEINNNESLQENVNHENENKVVNETDKKHEKCIEHKKIKEVYCVEDGELVCVDCALFSFHRNHEIRSIASLFNAEKEMVNAFEAIIKEKEEIESKYLSKEVENEIFELLDKKKCYMSKEIESCFKELHSILDLKEKEVLQSLEETVKKIGTKIQNKIKNEFENQEQYAEWQKEVKSIKQSIKKDFHSQKNIETTKEIANLPKEFTNETNEKFQKLIKEKFGENKIKEGKEILKMFHLKEKNLITILEHELEELKFINQQEVIKESINSITLLSATFETSLIEEKKKGQFLLNKNGLSEEITESMLPCESKKHINQEELQENQQRKASQSNSHEEESLLDFTNELQSNIINKSIQKTNSCENIPLKSQHAQHNKNEKKIMLEKNQNKLQTKKLSEVFKQSQILNKSKSIQSFEKPRSASIDVSSSIVRNSSSLRKSTLSKTSSKKKIETKFSHQTLIEQILEGTVETVDLSGQSISEEELLHISKVVSHSEKVKTFKLMRCNIDDSFIGRCFKYFLNVERINMAQNKLTQESVDCILSILKTEKNYQLNYLNLGQNRIIERKNRKLLEEFKNLGINIIL